MDQNRTSPAPLETPNLRKLGLSPVRSAGIACFAAGGVVAGLLTGDQGAAILGGVTAGLLPVVYHRIRREVARQRRLSAEEKSGEWWDQQW